MGLHRKLEALVDPQHEYHEEALDTLGNDHDLNAKPDITLIEAKLEALAKKWALRTRRKTRPAVSMPRSVGTYCCLAKR